jgi:hypothetical protein
MSDFKSSASLLSRLKYIKRFIKAEGIKECLYFILNKPVFYEEFPSARSQRKFPDSAMGGMSVPDNLIISKWTHYFPIYSEHLGKYRDCKKPLRVLEIGVAGGGSLKLWRDFFGASALIYGIDIEPKCAEIIGTGCEIRIGSQADVEFLQTIIDEMGGVDIVIDDGSHICKHVVDSFAFLFPKLNDDGVYLIEDLSTSYWPGVYKGGLRRSKTSIEYLKRQIDSVNSPFLRRSLGKDCHKDIESIHFYRSVAIIRKSASQALEVWRND